MDTLNQSMTSHVESVKAELAKIRENSLAQSEKKLMAMQGKINKIGTLVYEVSELHNQARKELKMTMENTHIDEQLMQEVVTKLVNLDKQVQILQKLLPTEILASQAHEQAKKDVETLSTVVKYLVAGIVVLFALLLSK
eukprot:TRINITY_DN5730_c0_g1_i2.p1 TRINITY_DN5730_c0_g1~~TRINITY_DN5730_c0_g1_i2.p1  ORF type:complete len:139 (+),score=21.71 TRINITY_DN5730_c0_g1_i2:241-657(+)